MKVTTGLILSSVLALCFLLGMVFGGTVFVEKMHAAQCEQMENER